MAIINQAAQLADSLQIQIGGKNDLAVVPVQPSQQICGSFNNQAGGNITIVQPINPLRGVLDALEFPAENVDELIAISDELQTYFSDRDVVGLEVKLNVAGRPDLFEDAAYEKA